MRLLHRILLFLGCLFIAAFGYSQSASCPTVTVNPPNTNYNCAPSDPACATVTATFPDIRQTIDAANAYICNSIPFSGNYGFNIGGTQVSANQDDYYSPIVNLPFNFCYYGNTYNKCVIGPNGTICFNTSLAGQHESYTISLGSPLPSPNVGADNSHLNTIFACYHDVDPSVFFQNGTIKWQVIGSAPCRKLVVNWYNLPQYDCNSKKSTFQCVLYENTNVIEMYIQQKPVCSSWEDGQAMIGIQNSAGTQGIAAPGRNQTVWTTSTSNSEAWQFIPNGSSLLQSVALYNANTHTQVEVGTPVAAGAGLLNATFTQACTSVPGTANYYVKAAYISCTGTNFADSAQVTVSASMATPIPTVISPVTYCQGAVTSPLSATGTALKWYATATGGTGSSSAPTPSSAVGSTTTYYVTQTLNGCESPRTPITITVISTASDTIPINVCPAQIPYTWNAHTLTSDGYYSDTSTSALGCTQITVANFHVVQMITSAETDTICTSQLPYIWNGHVLNTTGIYIDTLITPAGCDSVITLNLTVNQSSSSVLNDTICSTLLPYVWNGQNYTGTGTYYDTLVNTVGCDSLAALNLVVKQATSSTENVTVCVSQLPYVWNGQSLNTSGVYRDTLLNIAGCDSFLTLNFAAVSAYTDSQTAAICYYQQPSYLWNGQTLTASGIYRDTFTSVAGCDSFVILNLVIDSLNFTVPTHVDIICFGIPTGSITSSAAGGTGATYTWTYNSSAYIPNSPTNPTNLQAGSYRQIATDIYGCRDTANFVITQPTQLLLNNFTITQARCGGGNDGSITSVASGGVPNYTYSWSHNNLLNNTVANNLQAGTYTQTVTDANGCTTNRTYTIIEPAALSLQLSTTMDPCSLTPSGQITSNASGGTPAYTYGLIQNATSLETNTTGVFGTSTPLVSGTYTVNLTDNNNCSISQTVIVPARQPDIFDVTTDSVSCYGYQDGQIHLTPLTANTPYRYSIDGGSTFSYDSNFYNLSSGNYNIYVRNGNGCDTILNMAVQQSSQAFASITPSDTTIQIGESVVLSSELSPYSQSAVNAYRWSPAEGLSCSDCPNPLVTSYQRDNEYNLTITYNDICEVETGATVIIEGEGAVYIPNAFSPNGDGNNDYFEVYGKVIETAKLRIFNRWGEKIYDSMNNAMGRWDGTYNGVLQSPMVYTYEIEIVFLNGKTKRQMGSVTLIR